MSTRTLPKSIINSFFMLGIVSAIAFRALTILGRVSPEWVRPVWYGAVFGYICFFGFRYYIARKRKATILGNQLIEKLRGTAVIGTEDREELAYIVSSLVKSKEMWNYLFIFVISIVAIAIDLILPYLLET